MSSADWACLAIIVLGIVLFLYGANYYDAVIGWIGVSLFVIGIIAVLFIHVFAKSNKESRSPEPAKPALSL
jgi:membrane-bound ClpP family serine protease